MEVQALYQHFLNSKGICTDSRKVGKNQMFFALSGQNFDGNHFAEQAIEMGARMAIIDNKKYKTNKNCILVPDVLKCLQELSLFHRKSLNTIIIAVTGTNGKTSTKELISHVLQKKYKVSFTQGNLNNHIGVPLTLLSFTKDTEIGVVEMGANHKNEISNLCQIALPDYGLITNIGKAHLEGFGSFEGVIKAKSELYNYCKNNRKKVFVNGKDELLIKLSSGLDRITYGDSTTEKHDAQLVSADPFLIIKWKHFLIQTQLVGEYNINNVLAAIKVGSYFHVPDTDIVDAISEYKPQNNRSQLTKTQDNTLIIDAYNANPSSMELSIRNFVNIKSTRKLLILGDMFELGKVAVKEHQKIIELVKSIGFTEVLFVGKNFFSLRKKAIKTYQFFLNTDDIIKFLSQNKISGYTILLKASRGIQLEKVLDFL
jgi:UDP-N-acetylmuramoyl-tripeptide--D-alanyl-D-alanine ligase